MNDTPLLSALATVLEQRKQADPNQSYVASLYAAGDNQMLKKIGEEAIEVVIAAKNNDPKALIKETADLWFHTLVLLAAHDLTPQAVLDELGQRFGISGYSEKASRNTCDSRLSTT